MLGSKGKANCYKCNQASRISAFKSVLRKRKSVFCANCNAEISLTPENSFGYGYSCCQCNNILGFEYNNQLIAIDTVLNANWNYDLFDRSIRINQFRYFANVITKKDILVIRMMQLFAMNDEPSFVKFRKDDLYGGILVDNIRKLYIGYIVWSNIDNELRLNQIYIDRKYRKKGYASELIKFWLNAFLEKGNSKFLVESPNRLTVNLLNKLGYLNNKDPSKITCYSFMSM